ncbi:MAG: hypothetical protein RL347_1755 [Actinomycetota bacterium]
MTRLAIGRIPNDGAAMAPTTSTQHTAALLREAFGRSPFTRADAQAAGISVDRLRQALRWGLVTRARRGWYVVGDSSTTPTGADASEDAGNPDRLAPTVLSLVYELQARRAQPVIAGSLSARWWGTDLLTDRDSRQDGASARTHPGRRPLNPGSPGLILVAPGSGVRRGLRHGILIREACIDKRDIVRSDSGLAFTGALRTGIDCARGLDPAGAFIAVNSAVRRSLDPELPRSDGYRPSAHTLTDLAAHPERVQAALGCLRATLNRCDGYGLSAIRRVMDRIDPRLESALESLSWWRFGEHGLVLPIPQQWVRGASGRRYRVDFDFGHVIGEADGLAKYADVDQLRAEKSRQMDIELGGRPVVRWGWNDMWNHPERVFMAIALAAA